MTNPLLESDTLVRFDAVRPEHVAPAIDLLLEEAMQAVDTAETVDPVTWGSFVTPLEQATHRLDGAFGVVSHLHSVMDSPELRSAYQECLPKIARFSSSMEQSQALYEQYKRLASSPEYTGYDDARRKVIDNALRSFRLGGAELPAERKARLADIHVELSELSSKFSQNVLDATDAFQVLVTNEEELTGLPEDVKAACKAAAAEAGSEGWLLTLQAPVMQPVLLYCENRELREQLFRAGGLRASEAGPPEWDNTEVISRTLELRREMAELLGYPSFAEYSLITKMAESAKAATTFLRELAEQALPAARKDRAALEAFGRDLGFDVLEPWDVGFVSEKLRLERFAVSAQDAKPYFTLPAVLDGLFGLIHELYGVEILPDKAPVWEDGVRFFRVNDGDGTMLGQFYLDLYARTGKRGGAWMDSARDRDVSEDRCRTPLVYLVCNFGRGVADTPATLTHNEVIVLFHEMGHGLHALLTQVDVGGVSGLSGVEWDAIELPSQFMENFCWEWDRLRGMTAHAVSGEPLPRDLYDRMIAAKNFLSGASTVRQLELGLFDMLVHDGSFLPRQDSYLALLEKVRDEVAVTRLPDWHRFPHSFSHIFAGSYAAGYYSYHWAEVLSADVYAAFEEQPDRLGETGRRFRQEILGRGGSRSAAENFEAFRRRPPTTDALLRHRGLAHPAAA